MKHTNADRGTGGQFARSDGPKAKRIEVWLQPQALDLLDTLCKQWNVGRGKAISHLICNGPVAPAAWVEVDSKPPPTPSAPPAPEPAPEPPATPEPQPESTPRFKVGDAVDIAGLAGREPDPLGVITSCFWVAEPFTSNNGELTYPPQWTYQLDSGHTLPEEMLALHQPPAPEPEPKPEPKINERRRAIAPPSGPRTAKSWAWIIWEGRVDAPFDHGDTLTDADLNSPAKQSPRLSAKQIIDSGTVFSKTLPRAASKVEDGCLRFEFAINPITGEIWDGGLGVPKAVGRGAAAMLLGRDRTKAADQQPVIDWEAIKAEGKDTDQPTPSDRVDVQQLFDRIAAQGRERWEKITAEAKRIGIPAKQLERLLPLLKLSAANLPLSPEAVQAVHQELERGQRQNDAHQRVHAERLATINQATPNLFADLADRCGSVELSDGKVAIDYLLRRLPDLGLKPYRKLCAGLWQQLEQAVQWADLKSEHLNSVPARRALFWGVVLRLDHLGTDVPTDSDRFLEWCQFTVHQDHADRREDHQAGRLFDLLSDRLTTDEARRVLGLPEAGTELTRTAINDAYKAHARQHHPDAGGDAARFQRITEARDRLLLAVGG